MSNTFTRALGAQSGVQLNPLQDASEIPVTDNYDQVFAIAMRATRGRIDRPFRVDQNNFTRKLGKGTPIRSSALNEAWVHVYEALNSGASEAVVQRLVTSAAAVKWVVAATNTTATLTATVVGGVVTAVAVGVGGTGFVGAPTVLFGGPGTGASATATVVAGVITGIAIVSGGTGYTTAPAVTVSGISITVSDTEPTAPYLFSVKHLDCYNDGIKVEFRADALRVGGAAADNPKITLRVRDVDGGLLHEATGSLVATAVDDFGNSAYLPDVVSSLTDSLEVTVGVTGGAAVIATTSPAYGYDSAGNERWARSSTLVCFTEGGTGYATADYSAARVKLQYTPNNYAYIASGGSQSTGLLAQLAQLAYDTNRQLRFDVLGSLTPDAAIAFVEQLAFDASLTAHLLHAFWAPLKSDDPTGINPKGYFGTSTKNIAYACGRNASTDAKGFAPKNRPIAGKDWPLNRTGITQTYTPTDQELNALARARINPVLFQTYSGGGRYVFVDSLTCAPVESSLKKLISVADMSTSIDEAVTRACRDILQQPMATAIKRTQDYLTALFEAAAAAGWLVTSADPAMGGKAWRFDVRPNEARPYDRMDCSYWLHYDGVDRQIFVTQTVSR